MPIIAWDALKAHVLANSGSRPAYRDPVDARIISQVTNNTGSLIDSTNQVGGYPTIPVVTVSYNPPSTDADSDEDGYTDLEEWLPLVEREEVKGDEYFIRELLEQLKLCSEHRLLFTIG